MSGLFFKEFNKQSNLHAAWRHVRSSASSSANADIRAESDQFEASANSRILSIQRRIAKHSFVFPAATGILKDKEKRRKVGKRARPLVIATLESRVVQRAILQVLQPDRKSRLYNRLNHLREVAESPFNFGGTPDGGVPRAIKNVVQAVADGYLFFYKSDIGAFFTKIPHEPVIRLVRSDTEDDAIADIFEKALIIELDNKDELSADFDLFPSGGVGVPQGSSLSALSGNVLLNEFDKNLNTLDGVRCYRYIDDLLILGSSNEAVQAAQSRAVTLLKSHGMHLYQPGKNKDKAEAGHIRRGLTYLGVALSGTDTAPTRESRSRLLRRVEERLTVGRSAIEKFSMSSDNRRKRQRAFIQTLSDIDLVVYGWGQSYSFVSNRLPFRDMDLAIDKQLRAFENWFSSFGKNLAAQGYRRALGVALLSDVERKPLPS